MNSSDTPINNNQDVSTTSATPQHTEVAPTKISQTIESLTVCDYLGGLAVMLIFLAITRMISQVGFRRKSQKCSDVEFLERIWKMDASKINH